MVSKVSSSRGMLADIEKNLLQIFQSILCESPMFRPVSKSLNLVSQRNVAFALYHQRILQHGINSLMIVAKTSYINDCAEESRYM